MNHPMKSLLRIATLASLTILASCLFHSAAKDPGADKTRSDLIQVRADLNQLEANPQLTSRVPVALREAEEAVKEAEGSQRDSALSAHLVYLADRKVQTAKALAEAHVAEDQLKSLQGQ